MIRSVLPNVSGRVYEHNSPLGNAFYDSPSVKKNTNDPRNFIRTFLENKKIGSGVIAELGIRSLLHIESPNEEPKRKCETIIPELDGFRTILQSSNAADLAEASKGVFFAEAINIGLDQLPMMEGVLGKESCDVVVWHGAMLAELREKNDFAANFLFYKTIYGLYNIIKSDGYFIEFYPFDDFLGLPLIFSNLNLKIKEAEYLGRRPDFVSSFEANYILERYIKDCNNMVFVSTEDYIKYIEAVLEKTYSIMIIKK